MRLDLPVGPWTPRGVRRVAREAAARVRLPAESRDALVIAASEAATNVVKHTRSTEITVEWRVEADRLTFLVRDRGVFRWRVHPADDDSGWGFPLMAELVPRRRPPKHE
jgi:anti-sigma regulatory factor (Ser/Thr protein kinase)